MIESLATSITLRLRAPLYLLNGATVPVDGTEGRYTVEIQVVDSPSAPSMGVGGATVTVPGDPHGTLHNTIVTVTFPNPESIAFDPNRPCAAQVLATSIINHLIDEYRVHTATPAIRRLSPSETGWFRYPTPDGGEGSIQNNSQLSSTGTPASVPAGDPQLIATLTEFSRFHQPPYRILHMDSLAGWHSLDKIKLIEHSTHSGGIGTTYSTVALLIPGGPRSRTPS